ncbi:uncharacterized protein TNCV_4819471 [Trichonephila clavipes]|nr:uncharacterized protein TNCV_4819471 [Trichonephila clavipes]
MLSIRWSTTAELSNHHSSCRAVSNSIRVAGGGKRENTARPKASQRFSIGLRSGEYAGHAIRAIPSLSRLSSTMSALRGRASSSIKTKGPTAAAYNLTMGSRTSSRYRTAVTEPRLKMCRSVQYPNEIPAHTILLPPQNACCSVMFWD